MQFIYSTIMLIKNRKNFQINFELMIQIFNKNFIHYFLKLNPLLFIIEIILYLPKQRKLSLFI